MDSDIQTLCGSGVGFEVSELLSEFRLEEMLVRDVMCGKVWRCVVGVAAMAVTLPGQVAQGETRPQVIAYVFPKGRVIAASEIAADKLTRINYAFANIAKGQIVDGDAVDGANYAMLASLKQRNPSLEVMTSVGGWLWSGQFSDVVLTPGSRARFIDSVIAFVQRYKLDGLDIDWEYPGLVGAGNKFRPEDKANFTALLRELRQRFDHEQVSMHRRLLLSIAAAGSDEYLAHTEMGKDALYLDTVNLMAYDYYEPDDGGRTGNHAPLYTDPADPKKVSADASVHAMEAEGVPATKIVLGVPFYGHVWGKVPATNHGLFQSGGPVPDAYAGYDAIASKMIGHGFTRYWDDAAKAPYLYNSAMQEFVSYEDPQSLALKGSYVRKQGMAGVMFWEYFSDPSGVLLTTINSSLRDAGRSGQAAR